MPNQLRRYDKGEKRFKHVGRSTQPEIQFSSENPRHFVGMCPTGISESLKQQLLDEAIPGPIGDRDIDYPKYLYVVHDGAIYEARTSDAGTSYHGYPYKGTLSSQLVEHLRNVASRKNCLEACNKWIKTYIVVEGKK